MDDALIERAVEAGAKEATTPVCIECGRERTGDDIDYSPTQVIFGWPIGWYSGSDCEMCGQCITKVMRGDL